MHKRVLSILVCLFMAAALLPGQALAEGPTEWTDSGNYNTDWYSDTSTRFTLITKEQLAGLAVLVNSGASFSGKTVTLAADLDLSEHRWMPVGNMTNSFYGTFDGGGHSVSGMTVNLSSATHVEAGFFGYIQAGTVKNLEVSGNVTTASGGHNDVGGIVGINYGTVMNCVSSVNVTAFEIVNYAGGIVGYSGGTVMNSYNTGIVIASGGTINFAGGIVGYNLEGVVKNCYNTGGVTGTEAGGVVGRNYQTAENCYWLSSAIMGGFGFGSGTNCAGFTDTQGKGTEPFSYTIGTAASQTGTLCDALNAWVYAQAAPHSYFVWQTVPGVNSGYPIHTARYPVTFNPNGGTGTDPIIVPKMEGEEFLVPQNNYTKTGYTFSGWSDGTDTYMDGAVYTMRANAVTFKAQWTPEDLAGTVSITGNTMFGETLNANTSGITNNTGTLFYQWQRGGVDIAGADSSSYTLAKDDIGKIILCVVTSSEQTGSVIGTATGPVAKADGPAFKVTFDANYAGGTVTPLSIDVTAGNPYGVLPEPLRIGYTFTGWFMAEIGGTEVSADTLMTITSDHVLYAHWLPRTHIVTFNASGSSAPSPASVYVIYNEAYGYLPVVIKPGYTFDGWYTAQRGGTKVTADTLVTTDEDHVLYARWTADQQTIFFYDVHRSDWFYNSVMYVANVGLFNGTGYNMFSPDSPMTRGMIVKVLYRLGGTPVADATNPFTDVASGMWYTDAVIWAARNGIVTGYDSDTFGPENTINREQMAAILYRYAKYKGYDVSVGEETNILVYNDAFNISEYAIPAIQWACGAGLMQGSNGDLMPQGSATRAQIAAILYRIQTNVAK